MSERRYRLIDGAIHELGAEGCGAQRWDRLAETTIDPITDAEREVSTIKICGRQGWATLLARYEARVAADNVLLAEASRQIHALQAEKAHLIKVNAALRDRPDLGDRARRVQELIAERDELRDRCAELERQVSGPEHDYPSEQELEEIRVWPFERGFIALMDFVLARWWPDGSVWQRREATVDPQDRAVVFYVMHTVGWSGNEDMLGALMKNNLFWLSCYVASSRGGHYVFEVSR